MKVVFEAERYLAECAQEWKEYGKKFKACLGPKASKSCWS